MDSKGPAPASSPSSPSTDEGCSLQCTKCSSVLPPWRASQAAVKAESKRQGQAGHPLLSPASRHHSSSPYPLLPGASWGARQALGITAGTWKCLLGTFRPFKSLQRQMDKQPRPNAAFCSSSLAPSKSQAILVPLPVPGRTDPPAGGQPRREEALEATTM